MNERLEKVANDLQQAYDSYRGRVSRYEDRYQTLEDSQDAYDAKKPGWENPVRAAIPLVGAGVGALAGGLSGRPHGVGAPAAGIGGILGMGAGMIGQHGVRAALDKADPERRDLRSVRDDASNSAAFAAEDLLSAQEMMKHQGKRNPGGLYPLLQPGDEYDRMIEGDLHAALVREQQMAEERANLEHESMRAQIEKDRSKATKNQASAYSKVQQHM